VTSESASENHRPSYSLSDLRSDAIARLERVGIDNAANDVSWIISHITTVGRGQLITLGSLNHQQYHDFEEAIGRREQREPLQHILGEAWFRYLTLAVGPGVFVPRPETETLVDIAVAFLRESPPDRETQVVVDLCAGSGAIALAIATEVPRVDVFAVEADPLAAQWTQVNLDRYAADIVARGSSFTLHVEDAGLADELLAELSGRVDVLTCNPPYIPDAAIPRDPEVRDHDPAMALFGGADGLDVVREVIRVAQALVRPGGLLLIEHGDAQGEDGAELGVPATLRAHGGFREVIDHLDLTARPRVTSAIRS